jgi:hypothetical protein
MFTDEVRKTSLVVKTKLQIKTSLAISFAYLMFGLFLECTT